MSPRSAVLVLSCAIACGESSPAPVDAPAPIDGRRERTERAARIAREILDHPDEGSRVLREHDMSADEFSDAMYEIAGDPELAEVYETVRG